MIRWSARATLAILVFLPSLFVHVQNPWFGLGYHPLLGMFFLGVVGIVVAILLVALVVLALIAAACGKFDR